MNIRELTGGDLAAASNLLGSIWHAERGSRSYWYGADELCYHLSQCDHGFVAEVQAGKLAGIVLVVSGREEDANADMRSHWQKQRSVMSMTCRSLGIDSRADADLYAHRPFDARMPSYLEDCAASHIPLFLVADTCPDDVVDALGRKASDWLQEHGVSVSVGTEVKEGPVFAILPNSAEDDAAVGALIDAHARDAGIDFVAYNYHVEQSGKLVAGITAWAMGSDVHIDMLAVREDVRGHGLGSLLLKHVEEAAARDGRTTASVDTFSFQAPDFYPAHGYHVVFRYALDDGTERVYFSKRL